MINNPLGLTGGPNGINGIDNPHFFIPILSSRQFYYLLWAIIGISAFLLTRLQRSRVGRAWNYIREDETAAKALGVNVRHYKLSAFVLGAALAGVAGNIYASKQMSISPESFTFMESSLLFCIVLLGGLGSIPGSVIGAFVVTVFPEIFRPFAKYRLMFFGLALLVMMIFKPAGILPRLRDSGERLRKALEGKKTGKSRPNAVPVVETDRAEQKLLLCIENLGLSFGGVTAVSGMELEVDKGRITALIGPNGAGKTTVFNIITGIYKPMSGRILFARQRYQLQAAVSDRRRGGSPDLSKYQDIPQPDLSRKRALRTTFQRKSRLFRLHASPSLAKG